MKILSVRSLSLPEVKVVRFARFCDHRGAFAETFRLSDFRAHPDLSFLHQVDFVQANESFSRPRTIRGLHFQWEPPMGKLVRTVQGRMIDLVMDIRRGSPTAGKIIAHDMPAHPGEGEGEWIWVPPGFAHGNVFPQETTIQYLCSGGYNPACEAGVSPLSPDIDWSRCDPGLRALFLEAAADPLITDKDRLAPTVGDWLADERSRHFSY